jgi:hypothetical protein
MENRHFGLGVQYEFQTGRILSLKLQIARLTPVIN